MAVNDLIMQNLRMEMVFLSLQYTVVYPEDKEQIVLL
jgi:hypothetical protein